MIPGLDSLARLAELVGYHCRKTARPEPGRCPARIQYLTVHTADGPRVLSRDLTKRAGSVKAGRPSTHPGGTPDEQRHA